MNYDEYRDLVYLEDQVSQTVTVNEILSLGITEGTLIYGYTCDRSSFHLYLKDRLIHRYVYSSDFTNDDYLSTDQIAGVYAIPDKRVYPSASNYEFCKTLQLKGVRIPYTTWGDREPQLYYGKVV